MNMMNLKLINSQNQIYFYFRKGKYYQPTIQSLKEKNFY